MRICVIMQNKQLLIFISLKCVRHQAGQQEVIVSPQVDYNLGHLWLLCTFFPKAIVKDIHQESIDSKVK